MQHYACVITRSNESGKRVKTPCATSLPSCDRKSEVNDNDSDEPPLLIPCPDITIGLKRFSETNSYSIDYSIEKIKSLPIFFSSQKFLSKKRKVLMFLHPI